MGQRFALVLGAFIGNILATAAQATTNAADLPGFLSAVQSLATQLAPTSTSSGTSSRVTTSSSSATNPTTASPSPLTTTSNPSSNSATAAATSATAAAAAASSSGIDPHTRTIILAVAIPVGLILLAAIILLLFCCCRRRRRKAAQGRSREAAFVGNKDWEHGNTSHNGFNSTSSFRTRGSKGYEHNTAYDSAPLMSPQDDHNNHHTGAALGAGALAGAAAAHHHHSNRNDTSYDHEQTLMHPLGNHNNHHNGVALGAGAPAGAEAAHHYHSHHDATPYTAEKALTDSHGHHSNHHTGPILGIGALAGAAAVHHHNDHNNDKLSPDAKALGHTHTNGSPLAPTYHDHNDHRGQIPPAAGALPGGAAAHQNNYDHRIASTGGSPYAHAAGTSGSEVRSHDNHHTGAALGAGALAGAAAMHHLRNTQQDKMPRAMDSEYPHDGLSNSAPNSHIDHHSGAAVGPGALAGSAAPHRNDAQLPAVMTGTSVHPAYRDRDVDDRHSNPLAGAISRKPVPNRDSTGSNISATHHHSHNHNGLAAGAGALAAAAAVQRHEKHHSRDSIQNRPESWHRPLSSHPSEPSMHATAGASPTVSDHGGKRSVTPFSPDDVGAVLRSNKRNSHGAIEPIVAAQHQHSAAGIVGPTNSQRRSLDKRHSGHRDSYDSSRLPSRSPKRRSLSGGGEMWQADAIDSSPLPPAYSHDPVPSGSTALAMARQRRRNSNGLQQVNTNIPPPLPSSRHSPGGRQAVTPTYDPKHESSTSDDSWESAQAELNPWEYHDPASEPGRYPRFSDGSTNTMAPLIPPAMAWDNGEQRRNSGGYRSSGDMTRHGDRRRSSGASERRQRLRFSEGEPEMYNEHGLVGRAL